MLYRSADGYSAPSPAPPTPCPRSPDCPRCLLCLGLHLLPQQRNVLDAALQLAWIPDKSEIRQFPLKLFFLPLTVPRHSTRNQGKEWLSKNNIFLCLSAFNIICLYLTYILCVAVPLSTDLPQKVGLVEISDSATLLTPESGQTGRVDRGGSPGVASSWLLETLYSPQSLLTLSSRSAAARESGAERS